MKGTLEPSAPSIIPNPCASIFFAIPLILSVLDVHLALANPKQSMTKLRKCTQKTGPGRSDRLSSRRRVSLAFEKFPVLHLYRFEVLVRDNRDYKFGEADAKHGEVLEVRHLNPFIIDISHIHGIEVVKPNAVLSHCHGAVQRTYFGIINLHVCPAAHLPNACSRFRQSVRRACRPLLSYSDCDGLVECRAARGRIGRVCAKPLRSPLLGILLNQFAV